jgi:hypothetical protein
MHEPLDWFRIWRTASAFVSRCKGEDLKRLVFERWAIFGFAMDSLSGYGTSRKDCVLVA